MLLATLLTDLGNTAVETGQRFGVSWTGFIAQCVNFCIIAGVLWFFASKPIVKLLEERKSRIAKSMADAEQVQKKLEEAEILRQDILTKANEEAKALLLEARETSARLKEAESQRAVAEAEEIISKAKEATKADYDKMLADLRKEVCRLVVDTTAVVIGKTLTPEDQKRITAEAITQLGENKNS